MSNLDSQASLEGIAIIGMAGRFPEAKTIDEFWQNLRNGKESVSFFSDQELIDAGIDPSLISNPDYVKASAVLEDVELFDASFFGYNPREAEILDPQHRLFLECGWAALENAGYDPEAYRGPIGVYAGASMNRYFVNNLLSNPDYLESAGLYQVMLGSDKDFLTTRLSYKLNLRGPSLDIQTACSTSLVAVQVACQSLLNYQCDMALAGGVSITVPQKMGYLYQHGMIMSPDGHCRTFDADSQGTVGGQGVGIVVLKRLSEAIADRDHIYAVIKGAAVNNDGAGKVGFTAPGVEGQTEVIAMAHSLAGVEADSITYVEAHGTATPMGDPIEVTALTQAFRLTTDEKNYCAIGSVKTNIGHLDAAAGIASLIKTTMALKHKQIPPSLHFKQPNPKIDFANSPFYVNATLSEWKSDGSPRRAGVSSFGMGGTNAHVVLEEAPTQKASSPSRPWQLICLSAKTSSALQEAGQNLTGHLKQNPDLNLPDAAYTLQVGRRAFSHRQIVVCSDNEDAVQALEAADPRRVLRAAPMDQERSIVFLFPGQGSQYVNMGREFYESESKFRKHVDFCSEFLKPHLGLDLRQILYPAPEQAEEATASLNRTDITQPALFTIEYALAKLWLSWGIQPQAMIGHSIGEYVVACLAGVFSVEDALTLVAARGRLMQSLPGGSMLVVPLPAETVRPFLGQNLSLAAVNSSSLCVVSGSFEAIDQLENQLHQQKLECRRLFTSHAFHSEMMEPILAPFVEEVRRIPLKPPQMPFISNVTGTWITAAEATDPTYWAKHLRQTVQFADGVSELLKTNRILLEVGPGNTLSSLVRQHADKPSGQIVLSSLRHPKERQPDVSFLLNTLGQLWLGGCSIDWTSFYAGETRYRIPLPAYPFERQRYWIEPGKKKESDKTLGSLARKPDTADWFYLPSWKRSPLPELAHQNQLLEKKLRWLIFVDRREIGSRLVERLEQMDHEVVSVSAGDEFCQVSANHFTIRPQQPADYTALLSALQATNKIPERVVHLWSLTFEENPASRMERLDQIQDLGLYSLLFLAKAIGEKDITSPLQFEIVSNHLHEVTGEEQIYPEKATILGPAKVIPVEYSNIACRNIDILLPQSKDQIEATVIEPLLAEFRSTSSEPIIAYRGAHRWTQTYEPVRLTKPSEPNPRLREGGAYLITGGFGGVGLALAKHLAESVRARLILVGRSAFPAKETWEEWLSTHEEQDTTSRKIRAIQSMEASGAKVLPLCADVADEGQMQDVVRQAMEEFGEINGVIHAAGVADYAGVIQRRTREATEAILGSKVKGTLILSSLLQDCNLDFFMLCSTLGSILYRAKFGQVGYSAANEFLDAFAYDKSRKTSAFTVAVNWTDWSEIGMSVEAIKYWSQTDTINDNADFLAYALSPAEGAEVFDRILAYSFPRVAVSTQDLSSVIAQYQDSSKPALLDTIEKSALSRSAHQRPELPTTYVAPADEVEQAVTQIWEELLGIHPIGVHDNFFELGGHSLLATRVISRVREQFQIEMSLSGFFDHPTVMELAGHIRTVRMVVQDMQTMNTTGDYEEEEL